MAKKKQPINVDTTREPKKLRYVRLLSSDNAAKLISFVTSNNKYDDAHYSTGCIVILVAKKRIKKVRKFLEGLGGRFDLSANKY